MRMHTIIFNVTQSTQSVLDYSVPRRSKLDPVLFIVNTADVTTSLSGMASMYLYADDTQLYCYSKAYRALHWYPV